MNMDLNVEEPRRCPGCGYEYEPWVKTCPDCGLPVQTTPSASQPAPGPEHSFFSPSEDPVWTVVFNAPNALIANVLKSQLQDAGIPVLVQRALAHFSASDYVPHELRVPARLVDTARQVLDSISDYWDYAPAEEWSDPDDADTSAGGAEARQWEEDHPFAWRPSRPVGWSPLVAEWDEQAGQEFEHNRGEPAPGWYRSDDYTGYSPRHQQWPESEDINAYEDDRWGQPAGWIRVVYGILLLAVSLPFILQLLQQVWHLLNGGP